MHNKLQSEKKERDHLGHLGVDSRIIFKWSYGVMRAKSGLDYLREDPVAGLSEHGR